MGNGHDNVLWGIGDPTIMRPASSRCCYGIQSRSEQGGVLTARDNFSGLTADQRALTSIRAPVYHLSEGSDGVNLPDESNPDKNQMFYDQRSLGGWLLLQHKPQRSKNPVVGLQWQLALLP